jgi:hypothetical protein
MKKTATFFITSAWILFSRAYDAYCTHNLTPDLSKESNPLVSVLGMNWTPLLVTIGILTVYTLFCYFLVIFKPISLIPSKKAIRSVILWLICTSEKKKVGQLFFINSRKIYTDLIITLD